MQIATDLQPWITRGVEPPPGPPTDGNDAELQKLVDLINRYLVIMGLRAEYTLAEAQKKGVESTNSYLRNLEYQVTREGGPLLMGAAPTEIERETAAAREILEVREVEAGITPPGEEPEDEFAVPSFPTEAPPEGYRWELNELNQWVPTLDPFAAREPTVFGRPDGSPQDQFGRTAVWSERLGEWDYPPNWGQPEAGWVSPFEEEQAAIRQRETQQQFGLQQQEAQQQAEYFAWQQGEVERQQRAQVAAQPVSWLQYAAYTGEQPAIQPWMIPLMGQQYAGTVAGAPIPGWQGDAPTLQDLPELTRPSRQFQARMGPTALAQYQGYQQARTGIRPEETAFRLWSGAPPGGGSTGLSRSR